VREGFSTLLLFFFLETDAAHLLAMLEVGSSALFFLALLAFLLGASGEELVGALFGFAGFFFLSLGLHLALEFFGFLLGFEARCFFLASFFGLSLAVGFCCSLSLSLSLSHCFYLSLSGGLSLLVVSKLVLPLALVFLRLSFSIACFFIVVYHVLIMARCVRYLVGTVFIAS